MKTTSLAVLALILTATAPPPAAAQTENTRPAATAAIADTIPAARDIPYPGTMTLDVDATDTARAIFRVHQTIPVADAGPMVLLYPEWLPGNHRPSGPIAHLAGLVITANGERIEWRRDPVDVYAFHITVPERASTLDLTYQYVSPTASDQGRIVMTHDMLNVQWEKMSLYPAGYYTRNIPVTPSITLPEGWEAAVALRGTRAGDTITYPTTDYETLVDSPLFAGAHVRRERLSDRVTLNIFADRDAELEASDEQIAAHRRLVEQATRLYGAEHYDHYDFLFAITDAMGGIGLEHHRSSENGVGPGYFTDDWADGVGSRGLLPHEYNHSWNGKFRRGADLWTPDYRTPMRDSLLWVYEGQTSYWDNVLAARSGLFTPQQFRDVIAVDAARYDLLPARQWRDLEDTTNDPVIAARRPKPWRSWQRSEDYYTEGSLVWLEVDQTIRRESNGRKSLDDFARAFFGMRDGDWGELTYTFDDIVSTLTAVQPYDWGTLLRSRLDEHAEGAPLEGLRLSGYRLVYRDEPSATQKQMQTDGKYIDLSWSSGLAANNEGLVTSVIWDSPAFNAGLTVGTQIIAVNDVAYSTERLSEAVGAAADGAAPIALLVKNGDRYRTVSIDYTGGLRYPHLERVGSGTAGLDRLIEPLG